jgi:hypothetical protein
LLGTPKNREVLDIFVNHVVVNPETITVDHNFRKANSEALYSQTFDVRKVPVWSGCR